jgi:hypothetical protein
MTSLYPCPRCDRHVKRPERECPFCATSLTPPPKLGNPFPGERAVEPRGPSLTGGARGCVERLLCE